jgi:hypothetical protein
VSIRRGDFPRPTPGCGYYVSWYVDVTYGDGWINAYGGGFSIAGETARIQLGYAYFEYKSVGWFFNYYDSIIPFKLNDNNGGGYTIAGKGGLFGVKKNGASKNESFFYFDWGPEPNLVFGNLVFGEPYFNTIYRSECPALDFSGVGGNCENGTETGCYCLTGDASPPPPPPKNMCGCDCNTVASIMAEYMAEKQRLLDAIKSHVDMRTLEQLKYINKMLQDIDINLDLQPVIDELKRVEANLWNGINGG